MSAAPEFTSEWTLERVREVAAANNAKPVGNGSAGLLMRCPIHRDNGPSLSVSSKDDRLLLHCFGGCGSGDGAWLRAVGDWFAKPKALPDPRPGWTRRNGGAPAFEPSAGPIAYTETRHPYVKNGGGTVVKVRFRYEDGTKSVLWCRPVVLGAKVDGRFEGADYLARVRQINARDTDLGWGLGGATEADLGLYRADWLAGLEPSSTIYVTESESSADAAWDAGLAATCGPGGASSKPPADLSVLDGHKVVLVPDRDEAGSVWLRTWLAAIPAAIVAHVPEKYGDHADLRDVIERGSVGDLVRSEVRLPWEMTGGTAVFEERLISRIGREHALAGLFLRGGRLVRVPTIHEDGYRPPTSDEEFDGPGQVRVVDAGALRAFVQRGWYCQVKTQDEKGKWHTKQILPPKDACRVAYDSAVHGRAPNLRMLRGVVHAPVLRRDGSVLSEPGWDAEAGLLYLPHAGLKVPKIPERPTKSEVTDALALLMDVIGEFPFVTDDDLANFLGAWLTPALRSVEPGPYPLLCINAPMLGSGKSLLAKILMATWGAVWRGPIPHDSEEIRKQITSILVQTTAPIIVFDNVMGTHRSPDVAALTTSATSNDRPLGRTDNVQLSNDRLWCFTGNNIQLGGDLSRRGLWCTIDAKQDKPWLRMGFKITDPDKWVEQHRGEVVAAILTILRAWFAAGCPREASRSDSFASYQATMRGILRVAGVAGTFAGVASDKAVISADDDEWAVYLEALEEALGEEREHDVHRVIGIAEPIALGMGAIEHPERANRLREALPPRVADALSGYNVNRAKAVQQLAYLYRDSAGRWADGRCVVAVTHPETGKHVKHHTTRRVQWRLEVQS